MFLVYVWFILIYLKVFFFYKNELRVIFFWYNFCIEGYKNVLNKIKLGIFYIKKNGKYL